MATGTTRSHHVEKTPLAKAIDCFIYGQSLTTISSTLSQQYARTIVRADDVVLSVVGTIGEAIRIGQNLEGVNLSRALARLQLGPALLPSFLCFVFQSRAFSAFVDLMCVGTAQRVLNMATLASFRMGFPTVAEQRAISEFLEYEVGKIDVLMTAQHRLIELLTEKRQAVISHAVTKGLDPNAPMKESGVEWLGMVPTHWEVVGLGRLFREVVEEGECDLPVLSVSIHDGVSDRELTDDELDRKVTRSEDRAKYKKVGPRDLVYNMMRAWQGGFGTVLVSGMVSPAYVVARPTQELRTEFVELLLRTQPAIEEMRRHSKGVTDFRLRLYWDDFKQVTIAVPPQAEQQLILTAIDSHHGNALAADAERAIALLTERRSALISAAVTGKIDVRAINKQRLRRDERVEPGVAAA